MPNLVHTSSKLSHLALAEFGRYMLPVVGPPVKNKLIVYLFILILCLVPFRLDNCFYSTWHAINHLRTIFFGNFLYQVSVILSNNSFIPFGAVSYSLRRLFSSAHICSIGFRSGELAGHSRTLYSCWLRCSLITFAVCLGSLSCWKYS